jgi:hypothetical protein
MIVENDPMTYSINFRNDPEKRQIAVDRARRIAFAVFDGDRPEDLLGHELADLLPEMDVTAMGDVAMTLASALVAAVCGLASAQLGDDKDDDAELRRLARVGLTVVFDRMIDGDSA